MRFSSIGKLDKLWATHNQQWRDPCQVVSHWNEAAEAGSKLLQYKVSGKWWETLAGCAITLFITREYEHLVTALTCGSKGPKVSYFRLPHPSGLVVDRKRNIIHLASTRNPNQIFTFKPVSGFLPQGAIGKNSADDLFFVPVSANFYPGCLYIHDLALINNKLYANAVGMNTVVRLYDSGEYEDAWWPRCVEINKKLLKEKNYIQLNSIAAGTSLKDSYFSASCDTLSRIRPGNKNFPVDKRGVIFSGATREAAIRGLTRPHSIRWHKSKVWVDNSGYGEFGFVDFKTGKFDPTNRLPGWTRGLCFYKDVAFVGVSRVIPRFYKYAPGLDVRKSLCGIYAIDVKSGKTLGSLIWPSGNQIFALDWIERRISQGFPFSANKRSTAKLKRIFYSFKTGG